MSFRFDYKASGDGKTVSAGVVYHLAADWLVDSSPMSVIDYQPEPKNGARAIVCTGCSRPPKTRS